MNGTTTSNTSHVNTALHPALANTDAVYKSARRTLAARIGAGTVLATTMLAGLGGLCPGRANAKPPVFPVIPVPTIVLPTIPAPTIPILVPVLPPISLLYVKDVSVDITDGVSSVHEFDNSVYTITIRNRWSTPASGIAVLNSVPAALKSAVWSCTVGGTGSCGGATTGSGNINRMITLDAGAAAVFTVSTTVSEGFPSIANTVTVVPPVSLGDIDVSNNHATDVDTVIQPPALPPVTLAPPTTVAPTTTVAPAPPTTVLPLPTQPPTTVPAGPTTTTPFSPTAPQTIVVVIKQEGPAGLALKSVKGVKGVKKVKKVRKARRLRAVAR